MVMTIKLMGAPTIVDARGQQQIVRGHQAWALLARLLLSARPLSRRALAAELFPDTVDPLGSLRWTLASLRKSLNCSVALRGDPIETEQTKMYLKVITPRVTFEVAPGDIVQAGVVISNSEVGCGTLSVQPLIYRLVCSNGLIASDHALRKTHVGRSLASVEDLVTVFRDDTLAADDRAFFLKVRDVVEAAVSETTFRQVAMKLQKTRDIRLTGDPVKTVEVLANRYWLSDNERAGVLRHLIVEGDLSGYGLVNAVTHFSQDVEDYDRATEFEALGGKLIELAPTEWKGLAHAA